MTTVITQESILEGIFTRTSKLNQGFIVLVVGNEYGTYDSIPEKNYILFFPWDVTEVRPQILLINSIKVLKYFLVVGWCFFSAEEEDAEKR